MICSLEMVTPCQVERSLSVSQFVLFVQFVPLVALYRATNISRSAASDCSGPVLLFPQLKEKESAECKWGMVALCHPE